MMDGNERNNLSGFAVFDEFLNRAIDFNK